jgi:hypothetical protein
MAFDVLLESVNVLSVLATAALVILTAKACRASGVPYLLAIPAGFGLMTIAFAVQSVMPVLVQGLPALAAPLEAVGLLIQTYGVLFIAFAYARRTRVRILGESTTIDLLVAGLVTLVFLAGVFLAAFYGMMGEAMIGGAAILRGTIVVASIYLMYETFRNWQLSQKASQGIVTIGFVFFVIEQIGFILAMSNLGSVAVFLAYEGRVMGLFVLNAILIVHITKGDPIIAMRRLGLVAPVHARMPNMRQS